MFTPEELAAMREADEEIEREFRMTQEEYRASGEREKKIRFDGKSRKEREIAAKQRAYREANREEIAAKQRAYYEANREEIAAKQRAYYEANREAWNAYMRAWRQKRKAACRETF